MVPVHDHRTSLDSEPEGARGQASCVGVQASLEAEHFLTIMLGIAEMHLVQCPMSQGLRAICALCRSGPGARSKGGRGTFEAWCRPSSAMHLSTATVAERQVRCLQAQARRAGHRRPWWCAALLHRDAAHLPPCACAAYDCRHHQAPPRQGWALLGRRPGHCLHGKFLTHQTFPVAVWSDSVQAHDGAPAHIRSFAEFCLLLLHSGRALMPTRLCRLLNTKCFSDPSERLL